VRSPVSRTFLSVVGTISRARSPVIAASDHPVPLPAEAFVLRPASTEHTRSTANRRSRDSRRRVAVSRSRLGSAGVPCGDLTGRVQRPVKEW
jgi:hypothetical protein